MSTSAHETTVRLLDVALDLAERDGFYSLTRDGIADAAGVSKALPTIRLGQKPELMRNVMRRAIKMRRVVIVAQGLAGGDKTALKAPADLKAEAAAWLAAR